MTTATAENTREAQTFGIFSLAKNLQAYLKMGIMGFGGAGKTFTASLIAKGLFQTYGFKKPVFFLDTETGSDWVVPKFKSWGIPIYSAKSRAFTDLLAATSIAEKESSILIIDSISHFWKEVQDAFKQAKNRSRIEFQDWIPIKDQWARFTDAYLNARVHIILCGRAADVYEFYKDEDGKKQLEKTGTKMQVEKNLGYEPSLAVEMELVSTGNFKKGERAFVNRAYILKDRSDHINGMVFDDPTFETFLPHIEALNLGGEHVGVDSSPKSAGLFMGGAEDIGESRRKREILTEEIQGELLSAFPGQSAEEKKWKNDLVFEAFKTHSWTAVCGSKVEDLQAGLKYIKGRIVEILSQKSPVETAPKAEATGPAPEATSDRPITIQEYQLLLDEAAKKKVKVFVLNAYLANTFPYLITGDDQFDSKRLEYQDFLKTLAWIKAK